MARNINTKIDISGLLKDLGFVKDFVGSKGYIRLVHPDLFVEFLVHEKGRGMVGPFKLPNLGLNAQPLRFLNMLTDNVIKVKLEDIVINLPHPANFAIHKLIVSQRRKNEEKSSKDKDTAISILQSLIRDGKSGSIKEAFGFVPARWKNKVKAILFDKSEDEILEIISK